MDHKFEQLAQDLAEAWRTGSTMHLPAAGEGPATRADAYAIQDRMAQVIGAPVAGWKVGATVRAVQLFEGHDGPLPGRIFSDRFFESPAGIPARLFQGAKVECEFAFRLTRDLPTGQAPIEAEALAGALTFHTAIELAATRYAPGTGNRASTTFDGIADNGTGGAAVVGPPVEAWRDLPFETMEIEARIDGSPPIQAYSGAYRRHPLAIVAETFSDLRARGVALEAGMCVLTGSLTLPTPIRRGQTLTARFSDLPTICLTLT
jgi:2-keto-4-pentenoate hydratase